MRTRAVESVLKDCYENKEDVIKLNKYSINVVDYIKKSIHLNERLHEGYIH